MKLSAIALRDFFMKHPGATTNDVATSFSTTVGMAATACKNNFDKGYLTRTATTGKYGSYSYFVSDKPIGRLPRSAAPAENSTPCPAPSVAAVPPPHEFEATMETMAKALADQILARARQHLSAAMGSLIPKLKHVALPVTTHEDDVPVFDDSLTPEPPPVKVKPVPALRKVAILGLTPQQAGLISQEFGKMFDLKFLNADEAARSCNAVRAYDKALVMTGFISHKAVNNIKSVQLNYAFVSGGMTSLREALHREYDRV